MAFCISEYLLFSVVPGSRTKLQCMVAKCWGRAEKAAHRSIRKQKAGNRSASSGPPPCPNISLLLTIFGTCSSPQILWAGEIYLVIHVGPNCQILWVLIYLGSLLFKLSLLPSSLRPIVVGWLPSRSETKQGRWTRGEPVMELHRYPPLSWLCAIMHQGRVSICSSCYTLAVL